MFWMIVGGGTGVLAVSLAIKWVLDENTEVEIRKTKKTIANIQRIKNHQALLIMKTKEIINESEALNEYYKNLDIDCLDMDKVMELFNETYFKRVSELKETREKDYNIIKQAKEMIEKDTTELFFSSYRKRLFNKHLIILDEAIHKFEAYFEYLKFHKNIVKKAVQEKDYKKLLNIAFVKVQLKMEERGVINKDEK